MQSASTSRAATAGSYLNIPSLREYVVISHRERRITVHQRTDTVWATRVAIAGGKIVLPSLGIELVVDAMYRNSSVQ